MPNTSTSLCWPSGRLKRMRMPPSVGRTAPVHSVPRCPNSARIHRTRQARAQVSRCRQAGIWRARPAQPSRLRSPALVHDLCKQSGRQHARSTL
jgi:hypothetical protein